MPPREPGTAHGAEAEGLGCRLRLHDLKPASIGTKQIACENLVFHIADRARHVIGYDNVAILFEGIEIAHDGRAKELVQGHRRLEDHDLHAFGLDALHDTLDRRLPEIVGPGLHDQPENTDLFGFFGNDPVSQKVFAGMIGIDNGSNEVLRDLGVIGQQLPGILGQATAPVTEAGVVVMVADARVSF